LVDAYHVPKLLSQQLLPFGRSGDGLERLTFDVELVSALSARRGQSATCVFFASSSCSCSPLSSIRRGFEFSLGKVSDGPEQRRGQSAGSWQTVRVLPADGPLFGVVSGGSVCFFRQSVAQGRTVCGVGADSSRQQAGRSAVWVRTVRSSRPDGPRGPCERSAPPSRTVRQSLSALFFGSIPSSFRASACASRNRS
jgi:hypothetical protein